MKRKEAISVLKELLDKCIGLDGHYIELSNPYASSESVEGYQIVIHAPLDQKTKDQIQQILVKHELAYQEGNFWKTKRSKTESDTFIIYNAKAKKHK